MKNNLAILSIFILLGYSTVGVITSSTAHGGSSSWFTFGVLLIAGATSVLLAIIFNSHD